MRLLLLLAAALVLAAPGLVLAAPAWASERHPTQAELERELVCPTCHTPLDESDAPAARDMKAYIATRIRQGATKSQIENELVAQFGPAVLGVPRKSGFDLLAWVLPLGGIALGAVALAFAARYWSLTARRAARGTVKDEVPTGLDTELERRVDEELARFDG